MSEESEREEIKDETHQLEDEEQEELDEIEEEEVDKEAKTMEEVRGAEWEEGYSNNRTNISLNLSLKKYIVYACLRLLSSFNKSNSKSGWNTSSEWNTKLVMVNEAALCCSR